MAQGKYKTQKTQIPGRKKKQQNKKQKGVLKKGSFQVAPKKKDLKNAAKLKKNLEKGIRACIEEELTAKSTALEHRSLMLLKNKPATSKSKK